MALALHQLILTMIEAMKNKQSQETGTHSGSPPNATLSSALVEKSTREFEARVGAASGASLRKGFEYECQVSLLWLIHYFSTGPSNAIVYLDHGDAYPFDDLIVTDGSSTDLHQIKRNQSGALDDLIKELKKKTVRYYKATPPRGARFILTHLLATPDLPEGAPHIGFQTYQVTSKFVETHELAPCLIGSQLCMLPTLEDLQGQNRQWFESVFDKHAYGIYRDTLDSVGAIWNHRHGSQRAVDQRRALVLLSLQPKQVRHNVHDLSDLIPRQGLVDNIEDALAHNNLMLFGLPGSGKSALLDLLTDQLDRKKEVPVFRYSFFVSPSDSFRDRRLGFQFAIQELFHANLPYASSQPITVSSDRVIEKLKVQERCVVVLDGLDHLGRASSEDLEKLGRFIAALANTDNIRLLLSAQRPEQLPNTLPRNLFQVQVMPELSVDETKEIVERLLDITITTKVAELLVAKSDRNPLLLSYLLNLIKIEDMSWYQIEQQLEAVDMAGSVIDYLSRLLEGLDNRALQLLWYAAYLRFGFYFNFFKDIARGLGIGDIDADALWARFKHVFKAIGPQRFLAWHYSLAFVLETEKNVAPSDAQKRLLEIVRGLPDSSDKRLYVPFLSIHCDVRSIAQALAEVRNMTLSGLIRTRNAETLALEGIKKLVDPPDLRQLMPALFIKTEFYHYMEDFSHTGYAVNQAIANSASAFRKPTFLYPGTGTALLLEMENKEGLWSLIKTSEELRWLVDRIEPRSVLDAAAFHAMSVLLGRATLTEVIAKVRDIQWRKQHWDREWHECTPEECRGSSEEVMYLLGRIVARQLRDNELVTIVDSTPLADPYDESLYLHLLCGASEARSQYSGTAKLTAAALIPVKKDQMRFWHLVDVSNPEAAAQLAVLVDELDYQNLRGEANKDFGGDRESHRSWSRTLLSAIVAAAKVGRKDLVLRELRELENQPYLNGVGVAEVIREVCASITECKDIRDSLLEACRNSVRRAEIGETRKTLTRAFEMGLIRIESGDDAMLALRFGCGYGFDPLAVVERDALSLSHEQRQAIHDMYSIGIAEDPYSYVDEMSRVAALFALAGEPVEAESIAEEALATLGVYGYRKDLTFSNVFSVIRYAAYAGIFDEAKAALLRMAVYLPTIDVITDGDHTRYWFHRLLLFVYEDCKPTDSKLLAYIRPLTEKGDWHWRASEFLQTELEHVCEEHLAAWVEEMLVWYFQPIKHIEHWMIRSWALEYTQRVSFRERSDLARDAALKIETNAISEARRIHKWWQEGARPDRGFNTYFKKFLNIAERLAGLETILDKQGGLSSSEQNLTETEITVKQEFTIPTDTPLDEVLYRERYWCSDWFGCDQHKRAALTKAIETTGIAAEKTICSSLSMAADVEYFDASSAAIGLASMFARMGRLDDLLALMTESVAHFKRRFSHQDPDLSFAEALLQCRFHSLDLEDIL